MAMTVADLQLSLAQRLGEDSAPNVTNEKARRLAYLNEAYRSILRKNYWWFTEKLFTFNSVANQTKYGTADGFPSDFRKFLEVRCDGRLIVPVSQPQAFQSYDANYSTHSEGYFVFAGEMYPTPVFPSSGTNNITGKYYYTPAKLNLDADLIVIPDIFSDVLVAYAYARMALKRGKRGSSADGFDEWKEILKDMQVEQNNYLFGLQQEVETEAMYA
jgi:hypothetical protein